MQVDVGQKQVKKYFTKYFNYFTLYTSITIT